jgi:hypothetical protein
VGKSANHMIQHSLIVSPWRIVCGW